MAEMAKASAVVLTENVYSRRSVWKEDDINIKRKDVTNKVWEEVDAACGMPSGKYIPKTGMLY